MKLFGSSKNLLGNEIYIKKGIQPGKTLAIFGGVHGNETVGVLSIKEILDEIEIESGEVYFVLANIEAIQKGVRFVEKNLNRLFSKENTGETAEDRRAQELMGILDKCDALLDIHASNSQTTEPFIITSGTSLNVAKIFSGVNIISFGWENLEEGSTDAYMTSQGKTGICIECGSVYEPEKNIPLAKQSIYEFLQYYGAIPSNSSQSNSPKRYIEAIKIGIKKSEQFYFTKEFNDFSPLEEGQIFAIDGEGSYVAGKNEVIIFPRPNKPVGGEVFIVGKETYIS